MPSTQFSAGRSYCDLQRFDAMKSNSSFLLNQTICGQASLFLDYYSHAFSMAYILKMCLLLCVHIAVQAVCLSQSDASPLQPGFLPLQVLPGVHAIVDFPQDHSFLWVSICFSGGSSRNCRWISAPPWTFIGCRGTAASP